MKENKTSAYHNHNDSYGLLLAKLQEFIRKYYINRIIKGGIYFAALFLISFLLVTVFEYFGHFGTGTRTVLFYTFLAINLFILVRYIIIPLGKLFNLGQTLSYNQAADIIGQHFGEVKDKLLNTLQLKAQAGQHGNGMQKSLIEASINQKINELKPVPFVNAVDYKSNRKYLKYALIPFAVLLILLFSAPYMLVESTTRLVEHNKKFVRQAPFEFVLENDSLVGIKQEDYKVNLKIKGKELPAEVFVVVDGNPFKMLPNAKNEFEYTLKNLQKDLSFQFTANGFSSEDYDLKVLPRPFLQKFEVKLSYPSYLGKKDDILQNVGDLTIPQGTKVSWNFYAENTEGIELLFKEQETKAERKGTNLYTYNNRFLKDDSYYLKIHNQYLQSSDSIQYFVNVIPDAFPSVQVIQEQDSMKLKNLYFTGEISDDYGFNRLLFSYRYSKSEDSAKMRKPLQRQSIAIASNKLMQNFYHFWDVNQLDIKPGDEIEYYFEVWDNDGVNGSKSARSQKFHFKAPSEKELEEKTEASNQNIQDKMETAIRQAAQLQKDMQEAKMKMMEKKNMDWQDKKFIEDILKKQEKLQNTVNDIQKEFNKNLQEQQEFKEMDEKILEKQKALQEMFDKVMDEETKKLLEQFQKMLDENKKEDLQKQIEKMNLEDKEVEKELDRMMELFKQMAFEQKLQENIDKLEKLAKEQEKLAKESEQKNANSEEIKKKQDELNKKFDELKKDMEELNKKNDELENKHDLEETKKEQEDIENEMDQSSESLQSKQNKKASQSQKSAASKMQKMSEKMKDMQSAMEEEESGEDYQALRQILENLMYLSFEQEKVMNEFKTLNNYNPRYVELSQKQRKLKDDAKMIEDSLLALSKRVMQIKSFVNKEIGLINFNMDKSLEFLADRSTPQARVHQQFTMTSVNNLAVMLSEVMKQMQQQMAESECKKSGGKACKMPKKPGKGKPSMKQMREMQEQLNGQMQMMKSGQGKQGQMSKELAQMAARQEAIRRELQKMQQQMDKEKGSKPGMGGMNELQKMMDKTEEEILNRKITEETIKRQKDILVRMLEFEKAEKQQEFEEKRESKTATDQNRGTPPSLEKYKQMKEKEVELLRSVPPALNPYYRGKVKEYFQNLK